LGERGHVLPLRHKWIAAARIPVAAMQDYSLYLPVHRLSRIADCADRRKGGNNIGSSQRRVRFMVIYLLDDGCLIFGAFYKQSQSADSHPEEIIPRC
jgi:hypothetical protein